MAFSQEEWWCGLRSAPRLFFQFRRPYCGRVCRYQADTKNPNDCRISPVIFSQGGLSECHHYRSCYAQENSRCEQCDLPTPTWRLIVGHSAWGDIGSTSLFGFRRNSAPMAFSLLVSDASNLDWMERIRWLPRAYSITGPILHAKNRMNSFTV